MNPSHYRKIYYGSALAGFALLVLFPVEIIGFLFDIVHSLIDVLIELLHRLFEIGLELGHLLFEMLEMSLDHLIEHVFHTELHATQTIVFYIILLPGIYMVYRIARVLLSFGCRCANRLANTCTEYKIRTVSYWQSIDSLEKIKWIAAFAAGLYLIFLTAF